MSLVYCRYGRFQHVSPENFGSYAAYSNFVPLIRLLKSLTQFHFMVERMMDEILLNILDMSGKFC